MRDVYAANRRPEVTTAQCELRGRGDSVSVMDRGPWGIEPLADDGSDAENPYYLLSGAERLVEGDGLGGWGGA